MITEVIRESDIELYSLEMQEKIIKKQRIRRILNDRIKIQRILDEVSPESFWRLQKLESELLKEEIRLQKEITADGTSFLDIPDIEEEEDC